MWGDDVETILKEILAELTEQTRVLRLLEEAVEAEKADLFEPSNDDDG
jgi:hypothetical protein